MRPPRPPRPTPTLPKYRIKEFNGAFTIEKLGKRKVEAKTFFERMYNGKYWFVSEYSAISSGFESLKKAEETLKQIISETEVKYHYFKI